MDPFSAPAGALKASDSTESTYFPTDTVYTFKTYPACNTGRITSNQYATLSKACGEQDFKKTQ